MRNLLAHVPKGTQAMVAAGAPTGPRTIFEQDDTAAAKKQLRQVGEPLKERFPKVVAILEEAAEDIFASYHFPSDHRRQIASTNPLERLDKELRRSSAVARLFPNRSAVVRLFGVLLIEPNDEWRVGRRYFNELSMRQILDPPKPDSTFQLAEVAA